MGCIVDGCDDGLWEDLGASVVICIGAFEWGSVVWGGLEGSLVVIFGGSLVGGGLECCTVVGGFVVVVVEWLAVGGGDGGGGGAVVGGGVVVVVVVVVVFGAMHDHGIIMQFKPIWHC